MHISSILPLPSSNSTNNQIYPSSPPSIHSASIHSYRSTKSVRSTRYNTYYTNPNSHSRIQNYRTESEECLLNIRDRKRQRVQVVRMSAENGEAVATSVGERRISFGIGGAGNIRRPSDVIYPTRMNPDGSRRKSSIWSTITPSPGTSPDGKRASLVNFFKRGSGQNEVVTGTAVAGNNVVFANVDLAGKKKVDIE